MAGGREGRRRRGGEKRGGEVLLSRKANVSRESEILQGVEVHDVQF